MNVFNRIVMILLSLAAIVFGVIALLVLYGVIRPADVSPGGFLLGLWTYFSLLTSNQALTAAVTCGILAVVGLIIFLLELIPGRRAPSQYVIRQDGLGAVTVARSSVRDLVQYEAATVPGVMETDQSVEQGPKGLRVQLRTSLAPDAEAPKVGQMLQEKIQKSIQSHIGVPVSEVQVATQIEPLDHQGQRRVRVR